MADNDHGQHPDVNPAQGHAGIIQNPQSRRKFLRAAAVGAAGVAGVAGAAGVARASGLSPNTLLHFTGSPQDGSTPPPKTTIDGFFEETGPGPCVSTYTAGNGKGNGGINRYITFYIANLPAGNYSFTVTQTIGANTGPIQTTGTAQLQWEYQQANSGVHVVIPAAALDNSGCPTGDDLDDSSKSTPSDAFPVSFSLSATKNVAIYAHIIDNQSPLASSTTFTGSLSGDKTLSTAVTVNLV